MSKTVLDAVLELGRSGDAVGAASMMVSSLDGLLASQSALQFGPRSPLVCIELLEYLQRAIIAVISDGREVQATPDVRYCPTVVRSLWGIWNAREFVSLLASRIRATRVVTEHDHRLRDARVSRLDPSAQLLVSELALDMMCASIQSLCCQEICERGNSFSRLERRAAVSQFSVCLLDIAVGHKPYWLPPLGMERVDAIDELVNQVQVDGEDLTAGVAKNLGVTSSDLRVVDFLSTALVAWPSGATTSTACANTGPPHLP